MVRVITNLMARYSLSLNSKTYQSLFCCSRPGEEKRARPAFEIAPFVTVVPLRQMWYATQIEACLYS